MAKSPGRLCSIRGKPCYCRHLEYDFLAFALLPCFFLSPSFSRDDFLLRVASSVQHSSDPVKKVRFRLLSLSLCLVSRFLSIICSFFVVVTFVVGVYAVLSHQVR